MNTYLTQQGDMWDLIAFKVYGSTSHTGKLIKANLQYAKTFIFSSGVVLKVPDLDETDIDNSFIPPWRI